jgi:hypothetical protein
MSVPLQCISNLLMDSVTYTLTITSIAFWIYTSLLWLNTSLPPVQGQVLGYCLAAHMVTKKKSKAYPVADIIA